MTAATLTLTGFLLARIAEDEAQARLSVASNARNPNLRIPDGWVEGVAARVLAECEAKRRIVAALREASVNARVHYEADESEASIEEDHRADGLMLAVRHLAAVYADHADYRDGWRP